MAGIIEFNLGISGVAGQQNTVSIGLGAWVDVHEEFLKLRSNEPTRVALAGQWVGVPLMNPDTDEVGGFAFWHKETVGGVDGAIDIIKQMDAAGVAWYNSNEETEACKAMETEIIGRLTWGGFANNYPRSEALSKNDPWKLSVSDEFNGLNFQLIALDAYQTTVWDQLKSTQEFENSPAEGKLTSIDVGGGVTGNLGFQEYLAGRVVHHITPDGTKAVKFVLGFTYSAPTNFMDFAVGGQLVMADVPPQVMRSDIMAEWVANADTSDATLKQFVSAVNPERFWSIVMAGTVLSPNSAAPAVELALHRLGPFLTDDLALCTDRGKLIR